MVESCTLDNQFHRIVEMIMMLAPPGVTEEWGRCLLKGGQDFRLNLGRLRIIEVAPMATRIVVFMEWRKVFTNRRFYEHDPDLSLFEDAFGYLGVNPNLNQPWNIYPDTDLDDEYVGIFLEVGMRLVVKEIKRTHSNFT